MESDVCGPIIHRDDTGLDEDPLVRQHERNSAFYQGYLAQRYSDEAFRAYLERRIKYAQHRKQFTAPYGGPNIKQEYDCLVTLYKRLYGSQAFIRYWRSNPPPPICDP